MGLIKRALSNTFYLVSDWLVIMILGYAFWLLLAKLMPPADVGMFSTISNIGIFITVFTTFGFNSAAAKLISSYLIKNMNDVVAGIIRFTLEKTILLTIVISAATFAALKFVFPSYLGGYEILAVIVYLISNSLYTLSQGILLGMQEMKKIFISDLFGYAMKIILTIGLLIAGMRYFGPIIAFAIATMLTFLWRMKGVKISRHDVNKNEIWSYSKDAMIGSFGMILFFQSAIIILGIFRSFVEVGIFTIAFMLTTPVRAIFQSVSGSLLPITSGSWTIGKKENVCELTSQAIRYSVFLIAPILLIIMFFAGDILLIFARAEYAIGASSMEIIAAASLLSGLSYILLTVLYSIGYPKKSRDLNLIGGISNTFFCLALIPVFGMLGASVSYLLSNLIIFGLAFFWTGKYIKIRLNGVEKILAAGAIFSIIAFVLKNFLGGLLLVAVSSIAGTLAYFSLLIYLRFFTEIDIKVIEAVEAKVPRAKPVAKFLKKIIISRIKEK